MDKILTSHFFEIVYYASFSFFFETSLYVVAYGHFSGGGKNQSFYAPLRGFACVQEKSSECLLEANGLKIYTKQTETLLNT